MSYQALITDLFLFYDINYYLSIDQMVMLNENGRIFYSYVNKIGNDGWYLEEWKRDQDAFDSKKIREANNLK